MSKREEAIKYKMSGYNCCQAVLVAFKDELGYSEEDVMKLGAAFCLGMGNMEGTCGALIGAEMILGKLKYTGRPIIPQAKALMESFKEKSGSTVCGELKGIKTGEILCDCNTCVGNAVSALEEILGNN